MTCPTPTITSARERALDALAYALESVPGIRHVTRQELTHEGVAEAQLPAILIVERSTRYTPESRGPVQTSKVTSSMVLDVQGYARRGCGHNELSKAREALVHAVLQQLHTRAGLRSREDGAVSISVQPILDLQVNYAQAKTPFFRVFIEFQLIVEQSFDQQPRTDGRSVDTQIYAGGPPA